jgi:hypothetical protein
MLKEIKNGESLFMEYIKGAGVIERVSQSGLLFPGTEGNPMQEESVLSFLRRSCRINGFQLHELEIDGLVSRPIATQSGIKKPVMSFDDVVSFIKNQNK